MKIYSVLVLLFTTLLVTACDLFNNEKEPSNIELDEKSADVIESNNEFGFSFFSEILQNEDSCKNIMVSPLSVSQALSMALNGAQENTLTEMKDVLAFTAMPLEDINASNQKIVDALIGHDPKVDLKIANSVWYRNDFTPKTDFINNNSLYYNAEVNSYDPTKPETAKSKMNEWVDKNTKGKINEIIDKVNSSDVLFLINAVYFKAEWKTKFEKSETSKQAFTLDNGTEKEVETMIGEVELSYYNDDHFSVIKLPYGYGKFDMVVYLPEEGYTTSDIVDEIEQTDFDQLQQSTLVKRDLWLPKFEFSYSKKLNENLLAMGMKDAFDPNNANFQSISDINLYISSVNHKSYIKTNEEGTEAAAATSVTFDVTSIGPEGIIKINRSFLFAIVEEDTNSILFIGKVYDPTINE